MPAWRAHVLGGLDYIVLDFQRRDDLHRAGAHLEIEITDALFGEDFHTVEAMMLRILDLGSDGQLLGVRRSVSALWLAATCRSLLIKGAVKPAPTKAASSRRHSKALRSLGGHDYRATIVFVHAPNRCGFRVTLSQSLQQFTGAIGRDGNQHPASRLWIEQ